MPLRNRPLFRGLPMESMVERWDVDILFYSVNGMLDFMRCADAQCETASVIAVMHFGVWLLFVVIISLLIIT